MNALIEKRVAAAGREAAGAVLPGLALGALALAGAGFLVAAGWLTIATQLGALAAHLIVGLLLILPLALWMTLRSARQARAARARSQSRQAQEGAEMAFALGAMVGEKLARREPGRRSAA